MIDPRPDLTPALERVVAAICARKKIDARAIVVVTLGAHAFVAASVRTLDAKVTIDGARKRIEVGLRPPFFLEGDAPRRLATMVHEVLHIDPKRAGALLEENRHAKRSHASLEKEARALAKQIIAEEDPTLLACLAHDGEVLMRTWRHRPVDVDTARRHAFDDEDVMLAPVRMITVPSLRSGWW